MYNVSGFQTSCLNRRGHNKLFRACSWAHCNLQTRHDISTMSDAIYGNLVMSPRNSTQQWHGILNSPYNIMVYSTPKSAHLQKEGHFPKLCTLLQYKTVQSIIFIPLYTKNSHPWCKNCWYSGHKKTIISMTCNILRNINFQQPSPVTWICSKTGPQLNKVSMVLEMFSVALNNFWNTSHNHIHKILKFIILITASVNEKYKTMWHSD
jgi:hypothetical protein